MVDNPANKEQEKVPMPGHYIKPELWKDFEDLGKQDGYSAEDEFYRLLAQGGALDALIKKGVRVTVYIEGKEVPIENYIDPVLNKIKNRHNSKPVAP